MRWLLACAVLAAGCSGGVKTASGTATGYLVELDRVQVGEIVLRNVGATVIDGAGPPKVLLGMSFLSRLSGYEVRSDGLVLRY